MTVVEDIQRLQGKYTTLDAKNDAVEKRTDRLDEQVNGERGISAAVNELAGEIRTLRTVDIQNIRKGAYWIAGTIVAASIGWAFSVLVFFA